MPLETLPRVELRGDRSAVIHPENGHITVAQQQSSPEQAQSSSSPTKRRPTARMLAREELKRQKRKEDYERNKEEKKVTILAGKYKQLALTVFIPIRPSRGNTTTSRGRTSCGSGGRSTRGTGRRSWSGSAATTRGARSSDGGGRARATPRTRCKYRSAHNSTIGH